MVDHFKVNRNDIFFILKNQLKYGTLCSLQRYKGLKEEMLDMVVAEAINPAPSLTHGAAHFIENFAAENLKKLFVPRMFGGEWAGTMCLTEAGVKS